MCSAWIILVRMHRKYQVNTRTRSPANPQDSATQMHNTRGRLCDSLPLVYNQVPTWTSEASMARQLLCGLDSRDTVSLQSFWYNQVLPFKHPQYLLQTLTDVYFIPWCAVQLLTGSQTCHTSVLGESTVLDFNCRCWRGVSWTVICLLISSSHVQETI